jgi:hypothetical protein
MVTRVKKKNINCIGVQCNDSIVEIFWSKADVLMSSKECIIQCENDTPMI